VLHRPAASALAGALLISLVPRAHAAGSPDPDLARVQSELATTRSELAATRAELDETRSALARLTTQVQGLAASGGGGTPAPAASGPRLAPVNVDNPAISFVVDTSFQYDTTGSGANFQLQNGELFVSAPIDPFLRGYASINGSSDHGFDIEEAALITTALPWSLTAKGGRFFADVGRFPHWHDEALPFVDRPPSIDRIFGGETRAEGLEVSWLAPTDRYLHLTTGVYDGLGPDQVDGLVPDGFTGRTDMNQLTWLVHPSTYFDLTDTLNLEVGSTFATAPKDVNRMVYGFDATLRHQPGTSSLYQGFVLGSEWYWNRERFQDVPLGLDPATGAALFGHQRFDRNGGYAYVEAFFGRRYSLGLRGDYAEEVAGYPDRQQTYSAFATWKPSEFHRLRFQFDEINEEGKSADQRFWLQWTAFLGSHSHGFAQR
jgi:hypothetical protein